MIKTQVPAPQTEPGAEAKLGAKIEDYMEQGEEEASRLASEGKAKVEGAMQEGRQVLRKMQDPFLSLALGSIGIALGLRLAGRRDDALFVGQWAPTLLLFRLYFHLVKGRPRGLTEG